MRHTKARRPALPLLLVCLAAAIALALAAGGGDDDQGSSDSAGAGAAAAESDAGAGAAAVEVAEVDGVGVLADPDGRTLYTSDVEADGKVHCEGGCLDFWEPATLGSGEQPPGDLGVELGTLKRPDGDRQLTVDGVPLYAFAEEGPGELTGDGLTDAFGGTEFTWQAARVDAAATEDGPASEDDAGTDSGAPMDSGSGAYGGY